MPRCEPGDLIKGQHFVNKDKVIWINFILAIIWKFGMSEISKSET